MSDHPDEAGSVPPEKAKSRNSASRNSAGDISSDLASEKSSPPSRVSTVSKMEESESKGILLDDDLRRPVAARHLHLALLSGSISSLIILTPLGLGAFFISKADLFQMGYMWLIPLTAWLLMALFVLLTQLYAPYCRHAHMRYRIDKERIEIESGWLWRRTVSVPRSRIQYVDLNQGPFERHFELANLDFFTAGTANASVPLKGIEVDRAEALRDLLISKGDSDAV